ncbi:hypothetical protein [Hallella multisaccharivorax]|uniref:hypothetical protein n=1 Tax=Hallella multisaccharivorax TaxID=310514 RepID=UPI0002E8BCDE|nr:hypothetical protein [Hallella multisaccharivorax]
MTQEEYSKILATAREQFKVGKPLFGKDGAFHQVLEDFLNVKSQPASAILGIIFVKLLLWC